MVVLFVTGGWLAGMYECVAVCWDIFRGVAFTISADAASLRQC